MPEEIVKYFEEPSVETYKADVPDHPEAYGIVIRTPNKDWFTAVKLLFREFNSDEFWTKIQYKIQTLIYHRIKYPETIFLKQSEFLEFINQNYPIRTPDEKADALLNYLHSLTNYDGQKFNFSYESMNSVHIDRKLFFKNMDEIFYYIDVILKRGYIDCEEIFQRRYKRVSFSIEGLSKIISQQEIKNSRFCFIAMSFDPNLEYVFDEAIKPALSETGFEPIIVSKEHIASDKSITDSILAGIKRSRFTISDFTQHKQGVYFEAGYALGRGQKVIYTCSKNDIEKAHFDTRNFQHIVWEDASDLKQKLIDKIEAFIKD